MRRSRLPLALAALCAATLVTACSRDSNRVPGQAGDQAMGRNEYQRAVGEYRMDVRANPRSADLRRKLALALESVGNRRAAVTEFVRVADLLPDDSNAQLDAAVRLLLTNQFEDARARADRILQIDPKNMQAHIIRGNAVAGLGDVEQAVANIQEFVKDGTPTAESLMTLGGLELRRGQSREAEAAFKQAVVVGPSNSLARIALANYYRATGRFGDAEAELKTALELDPKSIIANRLLAMIYLSSGRPEAAEAPLKAIVDYDPSPEAQLGLSDYYVRQGRDGEAVALLNKLVSADQGALAARARLAGLEYKQGRVAEAHKAIADMLEKDPENAQLLVVQGGWFAQENKIEQAFRAAEAAVRADGESAPAHALLGAMQDRKGNMADALAEYQQVIRISPRDVTANIELARLHLRANQPQQAVSFAEQALRDAPLNGAARTLLASALLADGQLSRAQTEAEMIVKGAPTRPEGHTLMGEVLYRRNQPGPARRSFEHALQLDPTSMRASSGLALIEVGSKQVAQTVTRLDAQIAQSPKDPRLALLAGRAHATAGDFAKAEELFRRAIALDPALAEAYETLGQLYVMQKKLDRAQAEYQALATKQPGNVQAHTMVAMLLHAKSQMAPRNSPEATQLLANAKTQYEKIVALDNRATVAANNLAFLYAEDGDNLDVALNLAQSAKAASPDDPDVDDTLGWIYYKKNLPALAIEPLRRSVAKDGKNATYHFHLGMVYLRAGDNRSGRESLRKAIELGLDSPEDAAEAQKALASIRG